MASTSSSMSTAGRWTRSVSRAEAAEEEAPSTSRGGGGMTVVQDNNDDGGRETMGRGHLPFWLTARQMHGGTPGGWVGRATGSFESRGGLERLVKSVQMSHLRISRQSLYAARASDSVFGIEFADKRGTRDGGGRLLYSAHESGYVRIHDNRLQKNVLTCPRSHSESVNGCTSIDDNMFASYSDDKRILIWDIRSLRRGFVKCLMGHISWVKDVHLVPNTKTVISSGCSHSILAHDLNDPKEFPKEISEFFYSGLCRTNLDPSGKNLYFTTCKTNVFAINDLDVEHLVKDSVYYFMRASGIESRGRRTPPFEITRNRLEFVKYVPTTGLSMGQSLAIHPSGSCCAVRYNRSIGVEDNNAFIPKEWIALYDLKNEKPRLNGKRVGNVGNLQAPENKRCLRRGSRERGTGTGVRLGNAERVRFEEIIEADLLRNANVTKQRLSLLYSEWMSDESYNSRDDQVTPQDVSNARYYKQCDPYSDGIIKDIDFSPCGRLIASPAKNGIDVLAFGESLPHYNIPSSPIDYAKKLSVVGSVATTYEQCICAKFSPDGLLIVGGTQQGCIVWCSTNNLNAPANHISLPTVPSLIPSII